MDRMWIFRMIIFLFLTVHSILTIGRVGSACLSTYCQNELIFDHTIPCDRCEVCLNEHKRFCVSSKEVVCTCLSAVPAVCGTQKSPLLKPYIFCAQFGNLQIPPPQLTVQSDSLTLQLPRFYAEEPFNSLNPGYLYLTVQFKMTGPNDTHCTDLGSMKAIRREGNYCLHRCRIPMPGIDHKTDDHYYYDDGTPLETVFSLDTFPPGEDIKFRTEITISMPQNVSTGTIYFREVLGSEIVVFKQKSNEVPQEDIQPTNIPGMNGANNYMQLLRRRVFMHSFLPSMV